MWDTKFEVKANVNERSLRDSSHGLTHFLLNS